MRRVNNWEDYLFDEDEDDLRMVAKRRRHTMHAAYAAASIASTAMSVGKRKGRQPGAKTKKRERLDVDKVFQTMDDRHFRRKYRMDKDSFYNLLYIIKEQLPKTGEDRVRGSVPNGAITHSARLSMALRVAAGGDVLDIADYHGVNEDEAMASFWFVVDAINNTPQLNIVFPETYEEQEHLAAEFKKKSEIGIACCIGAIDGILIWIHKPTEANCKDMGVGPVKFFCGRKKKYGLNMQAICDSKRRFLWVDIRFPGATSDYFAFEQTELFEKLQTDGFLRAGLCIFGDAAYVNAPYMCVPYRNVAGSDGSKDAYNFFQSQLRINIECAFGMLVHRFGILRKPFPVNVSVGKINAAVLALCKLHNFCIDSQHEEISSADICDSGNIMMDGGMFLPRIDNNEGDYYWDYDAEQDRLDGLLDGGEHFDDISRGVRRRYRRMVDLPVHLIHQHVINTGVRRPERNNHRRRRSV
jgi:hypothetical protein